MRPSPCLRHLAVGGGLGCGGVGLTLYSRWPELLQHLSGRIRGRLRSSGFRNACVSRRLRGCGRTLRRCRIGLSRGGVGHWQYQPTLALPAQPLGFRVRDRILDIWTTAATSLNKTIVGNPLPSVIAALPGRRGSLRAISATALRHSHDFYITHR